MPAAEDIFDGDVITLLHALLRDDEADEDQVKHLLLKNHRWLLRSLERLPSKTDKKSTKEQPPAFPALSPTAAPDPDPKVQAASTLLQLDAASAGQQLHRLKKYNCNDAAALASAAEGRAGSSAEVNRALLASEVALLRLVHEQRCLQRTQQLQNGAEFFDWNECMRIMPNFEGREDVRCVKTIMTGASTFLRTARGRPRR